MRVFLSFLFKMLSLYATVPGTATSIDTKNVATIRRIAYESKLRMDSILPSVFTQLKSSVKLTKDKVMTVMKSGIWMEITEQGDAGQSIVISMRKPLDKAPYYGDNQPLGNEDEADLVWTRLYYNEIKKAIKYKAWGYYHNDTEYLNYIQQYGQDLTTYMQELRDVHIHQALLLTYDESLTNAPVSLSQQFNKNWIIPNLADGSYPAWDNTALTNNPGAVDSKGYYTSRNFAGSTTIVENIATACLAGSGVGATSKSLFNVDFMSTMWYYVRSRLQLKPVQLDGKETYILLVPSNVWAWTTNPNNSGSLGEHFETIADYKGERQTLVNEIGRINTNFVLVENMRAPTMTIYGGSGTYSIKPGYMLPGNNDARNLSNWSNTSGSTNYVFDLAFVLGENALAEYLRDPMVTGLAEETNYGQDQGRAAYVGCGIQIPAFDKDAAGQADGASTTQIQRGSAVIPFSRAPIGTIN